MTRLLIQCQGSPGPLSFKLSDQKIAAILDEYHCIPERGVIEIVNTDDYHYYIDLSMVSWMCVIDESKSDPNPSPTKAS